MTYTRGLDLSATLQGAGGIGGLLARSHGYVSGTGAWSSHNFYQADAGGNITAMADNHATSASLVANYRYDPFGRIFYQSGGLASANVYRFSSKEQMPNSGLYYYGFRFYDPLTQRWLNRDPIGEAGGLNLYGYVGNNPVNFYDPYGLAIGDWWDARTWFNSGFTESWSDQANSIGKTLGDALAGNWDDIGNNYDDSTLGQAEAAGPGVHKATKICVGTATVATAAAASLMAVEAGTGFRIEVHGTHGWTLPHLQGIQGPGWGQTIWRFPPHGWTPGWWTELLK